jgi:hypothetical protein
MQNDIQRDTNSNRNLGIIRDRFIYYWKCFI